MPLLPGRRDVATQTWRITFPGQLSQPSPGLAGRGSPRPRGNPLRGGDQNRRRPAHWRRAQAMTSPGQLTGRPAASARPAPQGPAPPWPQSARAVTAGSRDAQDGVQFRWVRGDHRVRLAGRTGQAPGHQCRPGGTPLFPPELIHRTRRAQLGQHTQLAAELRNNSRPHPRCPHLHPLREDSPRCWPPEAPGAARPSGQVRTPVRRR